MCVYECECVHKYVTRKSMGMVWLCVWNEYDISMSVCMTVHTSISVCIFASVCMWVYVCMCADEYECEVSKCLSMSDTV